MDLHFRASRGHSTCVSISSHIWQEYGLLCLCPLSLATFCVIPFCTIGDILNVTDAFLELRCLCRAGPLRNWALPFIYKAENNLQLLKLEISPNLCDVFSPDALCMSLATLRASQEMQLSPQRSQLFILPSDTQKGSREGNFRLLSLDSAWSEQALQEEWRTPKGSVQFAAPHREL